MTNVNDIQKLEQEIMRIQSAIQGHQNIQQDIQIRIDDLDISRKEKLRILNKLKKD